MHRSCGLLLAWFSLSQAASARAESAPPWCSSTLRTESGDRYYYVGHSSASTAAAAGRQAFDDALLHLAQELDVTVAASTDTRVAEAGGHAETSAVVHVKTSTTPLHLEGLATEGQYVTRSGGGYDACVRVSIPKASYEGLRLRAADRTVIVASCSEDADAPRTCAAAVVDVVSAAATKAGWHLTSAPWSSAADAPPAELAHVGAAWALRVRCATTVSEREGEFFAYVEATAELLDTLAGRIAGTATTGRVKGGGYSRAQAIERAQGRALDELAGKLGSLRSAATELAAP